MRGRALVAAMLALLSAVLTPSAGWAQQPSALPYESDLDGLSVQVPAGGGCPEAVYQPRAQMRSGTLTVEIAKTREDPCKGWFPNESRWIKFPWKTLGQEVRPDRVEVVPAPKN